jgi:hypothetical protein
MNGVHPDQDTRFIRLRYFNNFEMVPVRLLSAPIR